eukprot:1857080-Pleurochrysis_carterae.AAC.1
MFATSISRHHPPPLRIFEAVDRDLQAEMGSVLAVRCRGCELHSTAVGFWVAGNSRNKTASAAVRWRQRRASCGGARTPLPAGCSGVAASEPKILSWESTAEQMPTR